MTDVRRADPGARRQVILYLVVAAVIGVLVILVLERYRIPLRDWALADPVRSTERVGWIILFFAALLLVPLLGFAAYLWSLGGRVVRAREFPPPGLRVIRDTRVITGKAAITRGRQLRLLAVGCVAASVALGVLLWRLASSFTDKVS